MLLSAVTNVIDRRRGWWRLKRQYSARCFEGRELSPSTRSWFSWVGRFEVFMMALVVGAVGAVGWLVREPVVCCLLCELFF